MTGMLQSFFKDNVAATSIEYALIAAGLSIVIVAVVNSVGTSLNNLFFGPVASALK
jgi:pilus assembly protein Flp/PilA